MRPQKVQSEREPLKERRRRRRRRGGIIFLILIVLAVAGIDWCFWLPTFRVQQVMVAGPDADGMQATATDVLQGTKWYVLPRNSIFFFPATELRARILKAYPDISAVSISRTSFHSIALASIPREEAFVWCGANYVPTPQASAPPASTTSPTSSTVPTSCYSTDGEGILFAPAAASSTGALIVYGSLAAGTDPTAPSLGASLAQASALPNLLQFIKILKSLGALTVAAAIRGDEVDVYTPGGTRITYVLGREEVARQLAESAFPSLNVTDGSLEYVDLRFGGKVYFKKVGANTQTTTLTATSTHH